MSLKLPHAAALGGIAVLAFLIGLLMPRASAPVAAPPAAVPPQESALPDERAPESVAIDAAEEPASDAPEAAPSSEWEPVPITMGYADPFVESDPPQESQEPRESQEPQRGTLSFVGDSSWPEYPMPEPQFASMPAPSRGGPQAFAPSDDGAQGEIMRPPPGGGRGGGGHRGGGPRAGGGGGGGGGHRGGGGCGCR